MSTSTFNSEPARAGHRMGAAIDNDARQRVQVLTDIAEMILKLDARLARIEASLAGPSPTKRMNREWLTVGEAAKALEKQPFTVREWCRLGRIHAKKRKCGRGRTTEWVISVQEIERYLNEGLLAIGVSD